MPQHRDDFPGLKPLLIPQLFNKHKNILQSHCIHHINNVINQIFTVFGQNKVKTKNYIFVCPQSFAPHLYQLHATYILDFQAKFRPIKVSR